MNELKEQFLDAVTSNADLNQLCNITSQAVGLPIALTLATCTIIAKSDSYTNQLVDEYTCGPEFCTDEELTLVRQQFHEKLYTRKAIVHAFPYVHHKRVSCGCFWKDTLVAIVDCPMLKTVDTERIFPMIETAASVFLTALKLNNYITKDTINPVQSYLQGLLKGESDLYYQQKDISSFAMTPISSWQLLWVETDHHASFLKMQASVYAFCQHYKEIWCMNYENGVVLIMHSLHKDYPELIAQGLEDGEYIAVSEPFNKLSEIRDQLNITRKALRLCRCEGRKEKITFVRKYKFPLYLMLYLPKQELQDLYSKSLLHEIKEYDKEHCTEYYLTIRSYLLNNMNTKQMADDLNVHRNTVVYRLQRISELFHLDLTDCHEITALYLALFEDSSYLA